MKAKIELEIPMLPNFIRTKKLRPSNDQGSISVEDLSEEELRQIGNEWTEALIEHAKKRMEDNS